MSWWAGGDFTWKTSFLDSSRHVCAAIAAADHRSAQLGRRVGAHPTSPLCSYFWHKSRKAAQSSSSQVGVRQPAVFSPVCPSHSWWNGAGWIMNSARSGTVCTALCLWNLPAALNTADKWCNRELQEHNKHQLKSAVWKKTTSTSRLLKSCHWRHPSFEF